MAKPKLAVLSIHPAKNGGHRVVHQFESKPVLRTGPLSGGMSLEGTPSEEHTFGPGETGNLMKHITSALALKGLSDAGKDAGEEAD